MEMTKTKSKKKVCLGDRIFVIFNIIFMIIFMIIFVLVILYPIWNIVVRSFNYVNFYEGYADQMSLFRLWPEKFTLENYRFVFSKTELPRGIMNSVLRTVIGTILGGIANAGVAFILSRKEFLFKSQLSAFWIITTCLECGMLPTYILYYKLNLIGSFWVYILPGMVNGLYVIVMRTYMNSIPEAMIDQAKIDGASYTKIFIKIVSPICKPLYAAIALFIATTHWNSWFDAYLYNRTHSEYTTLQYKILNFMHAVDCQCGNAYEGYTVRATASVIAMLPIILFSIFLQKYYVIGVDKQNIIKKVLIGNSVK